MSQKSIKKKDISFTLVGKGLLVSYLTTIPLFIIFSLILSTTELAERLITPAVVVTTIVSIMFAGFITARRLKSGGWLSGGLIGMFYIGILYVAGSIVLGSFEVNRYVITLMAICIMTGAIGGITGINAKGRSTISSRF